ncbi:MAG: hypothetical protein BWY15_00497 [Firmicutes bacterium ADurb.Bin193]|nr:MAG: hypothetical protein BWY15_00497 [Firmicutes bacterium ADurb.Bin193]
MVGVKSVKRNLLSIKVDLHHLDIFVAVFVTENMQYPFSKPLEITIAICISFQNLDLVVNTLCKTIGIISKWLVQ